MARDMASLGNAVGLFRLEGDQAAGKLFERMDDIRARRDAALAKTNAHFDAEERSIEDVEKFVAELEGANGGPPLDASHSGSPPQPQLPPAPPPLDLAEKKSPVT